MRNGSQAGGYRRGMWSEDRLHRWILARAAPRGLAGSAGHDAAVLRRLRGRPVVCTDQTVEGVHFEPACAPARVGRKAAARALSDLAASAAAPRALLLGLRAPRERAEGWLRSCIAAVMREARAHGAELVGGDLCCAPGPAALCVTALGERSGRARPPGRDRARAGELVLLSGPVGGSLLGRHLALRPRVAEGAWLHARGARALMDVSDGLALDLWRMARASGVRILLERVPVHRDARRAARSSGRDPRWHALHDGEDHELIATLAPASAARALREAPRRCPGLVAIGRVLPGSGLGLAEGVLGAAREWEPREGGWLHGAR